MNRLTTDHSPEAIAEAATVYNMFVEGVLAEAGYYFFYRNLEDIGYMPGLLKGIGYLKKDESRHIGYGTFLLQRLICEFPYLYDVIVKKLEELAPYAIEINTQDNEGKEISPFGKPLDTLEFSMKQLQIRMEVLARAKGKKIEEIYKMSDSETGVL